MTKTHSPEDVAANILRIVKEDDRNLDWLSRKAHIPYSTLRSQLKDNPRRLTMQNVSNIAFALNRPLTDVVGA